MFNNSTTSRSPLALALSVDSCRSWEPLAIVEEDVAGEQGRAAAAAGALYGGAVWKGCCV